MSSVVKAAISCTDAVTEAQRAGLVGVAFHKAWEEARTQEESMARIMAEVVDLRMKKFENQLSRLDDVDGMLEAERVELELERRDLYPARCRHWFGGT